MVIAPITSADICTGYIIRPSVATSNVGLITLNMHG